MLNIPDFRLRMETVCDEQPNYLQGLFPDYNPQILEHISKAET